MVIKTARFHWPATGCSFGWVMLKKLLGRWRKWGQKSGWPSCGIQSLTPQEQGFVQWNNLTLNVSPLKVIPNRSVGTLESSQLQSSHSKHAAVKYERDFYHALPGIMNLQPWSSTGSKRYCKATIEPYATILKAEDFSDQEFSLYWMTI